MGTRGSVGVIYQEKAKLGYNHWDSYPDSLGVDILSVISNINKQNGWNIFKENISKLKDIVKKKITDNKIIERYKKYADLSVDNGKLSNPYCLFRKLQGVEWIDEVYEGNIEHYTFSNDFIKDSLFCEYAYIINLDTMKLEFYDGYQKIPQKGNFFGSKPNEDGYYPCRLVAVFNLLNIIDNMYEIVDKMNYINELGKDDPSVSVYFRKFKLEKING